MKTSKTLILAALVIAAGTATATTISGIVYNGCGEQIISNDQAVPKAVDPKDQQAFKLDVGSNPSTVTYYDSEYSWGNCQFTFMQSKAGGVAVVANNPGFCNTTLTNAGTYVLNVQITS